MVCLLKILSVCRRITRFLPTLGPLVPTMHLNGPDVPKNHCCANTKSVAMASSKILQEVGVLKTIMMY